MLSVIIPTLNSERALVTTLAALVPGATSGLVKEVLVADGGSRDDTAAVADVAGCNFMTVEGPRGRRLKTAAAAARAPWLLFLLPGTVLDPPWVAETQHFVERPSAEVATAVFRRGTPIPLHRSVVRLLRGGGLGRPSPEQGLLIAKQLYERLGGHSERAADAETDLLERVGRRRIGGLSSRAFYAPPDT